VWLAVAFALSLPAVTPRIYASDEVQYFAYLRSLWFDRDVSFENEYRHFHDTGTVRTEGFRETFLERTTATGRRINFGTIGSAILWSPFYAVADLRARRLEARGGPVRADGYSAPYVQAVAFGSAFYGWMALVLSYFIARRLAGLSLSATLAVWLGTPLAFYMYVAPPMSHACSAFAVALFVLAWLRVRERWSARGLALLGALAALMAMVREQDAFVAVGPALDFAAACAGRLADRRVDLPGAPRLLLNALVGVAAAALAFTPQALAYLALNGRIGPSQLVARKMDWSAPHALDVLASTSHGWLFWTPLAALALAGLLRLAWSGGPGDSRITPPATRRIAWCLLAVTAVQVYVAGSVASWTVAGAFGQRRFVALTLVLVVGLTAWMALVGQGRRRWMSAALIVLCVWWNVGLMVQFGTGMMDRQRLELRRNAWNTFVVVPARLPDLARRYLFDRASFYQPRPRP
jgi:hypothetical protein